MNPPDLAAMADCCEREVRMRERVYPRWIAAGRLTEARARAEIATMRAAAEHLRAQAGEAAAATDLFGASGARGGR